MASNSHLTLVEIKEKLGQLSHSPGKREFLKSGTLSCGIPRGVISEITGTARTEWVLSVLRDNPDVTTFWIEEKLTILPTAIHQRGVDLKRILIAEAGDKLFQALRKGLRSKLFDCVVLPGAIDEVKMLKALQLFARETNACVLFLSKAPKNAWAIPFQVRIDWKDHGKTYEVELLKAKVSQVEQS